MVMMQSFVKVFLIPGYIGSAQGYLKQVLIYFQFQKPLSIALTVSCSTTNLNSQIFKILSKY